MVAPHFFGSGQLVVTVSVPAVVMAVSVVTVVAVAMVVMMAVVVVVTVPVMMVLHRRQLGQPNQGQDHSSRQVQRRGVVEQVGVLDPVEPAGQKG